MSKAPILDPAVQSLIDNCVVPELVRQYLAEMNDKKEIAPQGAVGVECAESDSLTVGSVP